MIVLKDWEAVRENRGIILLREWKFCPTLKGPMCHVIDLTEEGIVQLRAGMQSPHGYHGSYHRASLSPPKSTVDKIWGPFPVMGDPLDLYTAWVSATHLKCDGFFYLPSIES